MRGIDVASMPPAELLQHREARPEADKTVSAS
jgi:hypothetical protein